MNQRILLPAIVIGTLFALLLTLIETLLPAAGPLPRFLLNAAGLCVALVVYGLLMQKAAVAAQAAIDAASAAPTATRSAPMDKQNAPRPERGERAAAARPSSDRAPSARARNARPESETPSGPREQGQIKWFSGTKGFGFIVREDGSEIFVHHRAIRGQARGDLPDGQPVSFVVIERDKGPQADQVDLVDRATA